MDPMYLRMLRWIAYSAFIVLWAVAIFLLKTDNFDFFSGLDWIVYFTTALAWATFGSVVLFAKHRRDAKLRRGRLEPGVYTLNWADERGIIVPRDRS